MSMRRQRSEQGAFFVNLPRSVSVGAAYRSMDPFRKLRCRCALPVQKVGSHLLRAELRIRLQLVSSIQLVTHPLCGSQAVPFLSITTRQQCKHHNDGQTLIRDVCPSNSYCDSLDFGTQGLPAFRTLIISETGESSSPSKGSCLKCVSVRNKESG